MGSIIHVLTTTLSLIFHFSVKTGQFIVTTFQLLITDFSSFLKKLATVLTVMIEDFLIFLRDVFNSLNAVLNNVVYICEQILAVVYNFYSYVLYIPKLITFCILVIYNAGYNGILTVVNGIRNILVFLKQIVILFGSGVWFIVVYVPNSILSSVVEFLEQMISLGLYSKDISLNCIKSMYYMVLELIISSVYFIIDVPLESFVGLVIAMCFIYIFIQFYNTLYAYLKNVMRIFLSGTRLRYNHLKHLLRHYFKRNQNELRDCKTVINEKFLDGNYCIICQEQPKCILVLPCKHLCLCTGCISRLMRYSRSCPICRKHINSTMKVFT